MRLIHPAACIPLASCITFTSHTTHNTYVMLNHASCIMHHSSHRRLTEDKEELQERARQQQYLPLLHPKVHLPQILQKRSIHCPLPILHNHNLTALFPSQHSSVCPITTSSLPYHPLYPPSYAPLTLAQQFGSLPVPFLCRITTFTLTSFYLCAPPYAP